MSMQRDDGSTSKPPKGDVARKPYAPPRLIRYGEVQALTRAGIASKNEGNPGQKRVSGSDVRLKENVVRVGTHPLGIGLYLFDYRAGFRDTYGHGRQFGVMAHEAIEVAPHAVARDAAGYLVVDYAALGIDRDE